MWWCVGREDAKTVVQLRKYKEQPVQEAEARKLAHSLGNIFPVFLTNIFFKSPGYIAITYSIIESLLHRIRTAHIMFV